MAKTGLQNETLINELLVSGSLAITTKNNFGVHTFEQTSDNDGVNEVRIAEELFKKLNAKTLIAGFKKEFTQDEVSVIRGIHENIKSKIE